MMTRAAQSHQAGHMRPAGRMFETPDLTISDILCTTLSKKVLYCQDIKGDYVFSNVFRCSYCMLNFCTTSLFYKHANELHSDVIDGTWHKCSICLRFYPFAEVLKRHYEAKHKNKMTDGNKILLGGL